MENLTQPQESASTVTPGAGTPGPPPVDLTGKTLGAYHILRRLGQGGMGQVYLAEQVSLKRKVALKLLKADLAANPTALQRFKAEAEAIARATHANIVQVYDIGEADGLHFMALEYVEGKNLREYLEKKGPPEVLIALNIMRQVASALQRASELGIIHRDIKPENILITRKSEVKVADFGLVRESVQPLNLTQSGMTMGTPLYMSPEQVEGKSIDFRTDIYSFGATCYHMLSGQPPFRGQTPFEVALQHVQKEPAPLTEVRPDLHPELCALVHKMMAKNPAERPQTGREIVREVGRLRDHLVGVTGPVGGVTSGLHRPAITLGPLPPQPGDAVSTQAFPKPGRSRRLAWLAAASILLALGGGLFVGWLRSRPQAPDAKGGNLDPENVVSPAKLRETELKKKFDDTRDLKSAIDLGSHYLKERPLTKADAFFKDLQKNGPQPDSRALGYLGQAMVLAYQDNFRASNLLFMTVLLGKKPEGAPPKDRPKVWILEEAYLKKALEQQKSLKVMQGNPELPPMIADALAAAYREEAKRSCLYFMMTTLGGGKKAFQDFKKLPPPDFKFRGEFTVKKVMDQNPALKVLLENPDLREKIADAVNHNYINNPSPFYPRILHELRKPWNPS